MPPAPVPPQWGHEPLSFPVGRALASMPPGSMREHAEAMQAWQRGATGGAGASGAAEAAGRDASAAGPRGGAGEDQGAAGEGDGEDEGMAGPLDAAAASGIGRFTRLAFAADEALPGQLLGSRVGGGPGVGAVATARRLGSHA